MSANPEVDGIVTLPASEEPVAAPIAVQVPALPIRKGPGWAVVAAVAAIAVIMSGSLGYFLYATLQQREVLQARLVSASATLASTQADLANRKVTATYVALYVADNGKVETDYETFVNCNDYSTCRTAAQQMLSDLQAFKSDRKSADVPSALVSTDSTLGDALNAAIAGDQEMIIGIDNGDVAKAKEGGARLDAAMQSLAKVPAAIGAGLR